MLDTNYDSTVASDVENFKDALMSAIAASSGVDPESISLGVSESEYYKCKT